MQRAEEASILYFADQLKQHPLELLRPLEEFKALLLEWKAAGNESTRREGGGGGGLSVKFSLSLSLISCLSSFLFPLASYCHLSFCLFLLFVFLLFVCSSPLSLFLIAVSYDDLAVFFLSLLVGCPVYVVMISLKRVFMESKDTNKPFLSCYRSHH